MFIYYNPNPQGKQVGDCVVRALSLVLHADWYYIYDLLYLEGRELGDMENSNAVWASVLKKRDFICVPLVNTCPFCYTVRDFCADHQNGEYFLSIGTHVVAVKDGNYYDSWDSGNEVPLYYWTRSK